MAYADMDWQSLEDVFSEEESEPEPEKTVEEAPKPAKKSSSSRVKHEESKE